MQPRFTVMIVDDDDDDRAIFCDIIHQYYPAAKCIQADNGCKALDYLHNNKQSLPNLLFLDINMPKLTGKQSLVEIKKDVLLSKIPVVIYTTSKRPGDEAELLELGAVAFITKPAKSKDLEKAVTNESLTNNQSLKPKVHRVTN
ncbi:MAG: response regulator [Bacteroidota bacterium]